MSLHRGLFIVYEGVDGAGKSTQIKLLADVLVGRGYAVEVCRDPGGTETGEVIRQLLLDSFRQINPYTEAFLYAASRAQLVCEVIRPALDQGKIVIGDRFVDSTLAYQGYGRKLEINFLRRLNELAVGQVRPDLTILHDLPAELVRRRLGNQVDRLEKEDVPFFQRVRDGFLALAAAQPDRYLVLDACCAAQKNHVAALKKVEALIREKKVLQTNGPEGKENESAGGAGKKRAR